MSCTAGTTTLGGNPAYPTSNDCPPSNSFNIGTLPIAFNLTSGAVSWTGTVATNDTGSTVSAQSRVFSGFCRDTDGTGAFEGTTPATAHLCWENNAAVGAACTGVFESCEQRTNGAFGPAGGANKTITAVGNGMSFIGAPSAGTLVSVFSIPPTFDPTVDAAGDLPARAQSHSLARPRAVPRRLRVRKQLIRCVGSRRAPTSSQGPGGNPHRGLFFLARRAASDVVLFVDRF
jgi:hypothetical protein